MGHIVYRLDERYEAIDVEYYCSDYCAQTDQDYDGWNGAHELDDDAVCAGCGNNVNDVPSLS